MILDKSRREVITVRPDDSVRDAIGQMTHYNVGCVVVVSNGRPVGILTDRDLAVRALGSVINGEDVTEMPVSQFMTKKPQTIREEEGFDRAIETMQSTGVRRLPVVDRDGKLRGLVSLDDIIGTLGENLRRTSGLLRHQLTPRRPR